MKIAFITLEYPPLFQGGAGIYAYNLVKELAGFGHEVHVITMRTDGLDEEYAEDGLFVHRFNVLNKPLLTALSFWCILWKKFSSIDRQVGGFDIVHGNGLSSFSLSWKPLSYPKILTVHHLSLTSLKMSSPGIIDRLKNFKRDIRISPLIQKLCIKRTDHIVAVSQFTKQDIINTYGITDSKIEVIHHGVHAEDYTIPEEEKNKIISELGINSHPLILFVGMLVQRKGIDVLLRAFPQVLKKTEAILLIVGSGNQQDYYTLAQSIGISDNVRFLGRVSDETLRALFTACDIFVLPSRMEGLGIVLLEAMAAGKPVVATNVGGIPELIETRQNGLLVNVDSEEELADAIVEILTDKSFAGTVSANNKRKVQEHFTWEIAARKAEHLYNELLKAD